MKFVLRPCPLKNVDCLHLFVDNDEIAIIQSRQLRHSRNKEEGAKEFSARLKHLVEQANKYDGLCE